ncbi:hypothetical protein F7R21_08145 [Burkholderia latens]|uniref:Uncharacterized protein n=1 Tax=Burkholderia latens TaxID=488446 RepID=A0A6H9TSH1_9BURK|nr:hypothetical protein F7R21_08145 [Burkholderia latens]
MPCRAAPAAGAVRCEAARTHACLPHVVALRAACARGRDVLSPDSRNMRWDNDSVDSTPE